MISYICLTTCLAPSKSITFTSSQVSETLHSKMNLSLQLSTVPRKEEKPTSQRPEVSSRTEENPALTAEQLRSRLSL